MTKYIQAIEKYLFDNPKLSKPALVELLTKRFSDLSADEAWIIVSRYFNKKTQKLAIVSPPTPTSQGTAVAALSERIKPTCISEFCMMQPRKR